MKPDDLQSKLRGLKFTHVTQDELAAYSDHELNQIGCARVESHIRGCFICQRELDLLREESLALRERAVTPPQDAALIERLTQQLRPDEENPNQTATTQPTPVRETFADYSNKIVGNWQVDFSPVKLGNHRDEVWGWQSEDGTLRARATQKKDTDLTIHFSTGDMNLEGARLFFQMRSLKQEVTLLRISESKVGAQVVVPRPYPQGHLATISIEIA